MEQNMEYRQQLVQEYKEKAMPLFRYLPWLEKSAGKTASTVYSGEEGKNTLAFPVYDGTLLNFVREATKSSLMDKNYRYVYTRNHLETHKAEHKAIENAGINEWGILCGILSKYVLGGRTKGNLWSEAVSEEIFYAVVKKMKEIVEYWDKPFEVEASEGGKV